MKIIDLRLQSQFPGANGLDEERATHTNIHFTCLPFSHYDDVIMSTIASQITSLTIVYSTVYTDQSKHQSSASLAFVWGIHRGPVNSPHKWPVTRKMFPFDDVIMSAVLWTTCVTTEISITNNHSHNTSECTGNQNCVGDTQGWGFGIFEIAIFIDWLNSKPQLYETLFNHSIQKYKYHFFIKQTPNNCIFQFVRFPFAPHHARPPY